MTEDQKDILIAKMIDSPVSLSEEELELIVSNPELGEIHEISSRLEESLTPMPEIDMADEWARMRPRLRRRRSALRCWTRAAAAVAGVLIISGLAVFTRNHFQPAYQGQAIAESISRKNDKSMQTATTIATAVYDNEVKEAEVPAKPHPKAKKKKANPTPQTEDIDIEELLRIEQARIDNEIAMQNIEIYRLEHEQFCASEASEEEINDSELTFIYISSL